MSETYCVNKTYYHFLSSLRQGLAAAIQSPPTGKRAEIPISLHAKRHKLASGDWDDELPPIERTVQLYGPGDVAAFDERIIVRMEPKPNSGNFEPNYFPAVEFADPDFPWRFSPEPAGAGGSSEPTGVAALTPWIALIALVAEDRGDDIRKEFEDLPHGRNQRPAIRVLSQQDLPNLHYAWRWAHVQATTGTKDLVAERLADPSPAERNELDDDDIRAMLAAEIGALFASRPELVVSRLLCPRRLSPRTLYRAFIVPTYKLGWAAALDTPEAHAQVEGSSAIDLAWDNGSSEQIDLPYFHHWEFRTSARGDFEYLVRLLEPRVLTGLGLRDIDCERPGFGLTVERSGVDDEQAHRLAMEGALQSLDTEYTRWGKDKNGPRIEGQPDPPVPDPEEFQEQLAEDLLNTANVQPRVTLPERFGAGILDSLLFNILRDGKSVQFSWSTPNTTTGILDYGPEDDAGGYAYTKHAISDTPETHHTVTIELVPEKTYHFRLRIHHGVVAPLGVVAHSGPKGSPDPAIGQPDLAIRLEQGRMGGDSEPATLTRETTQHGFETTTDDAQIRVPLPAVVPPIYGRWHAARQTVSADKNHNGWVDVLNLDPRHRAAAGLGSEVIRKQQEALMASAWDQIGAIEAANDVLRRAQFGREGSIFLHNRLCDLALEDFLRITAPVHKRIKRGDGDGGRTAILAEMAIETGPGMESGPTIGLTPAIQPGLATEMGQPPAALGPAFRRVARPRDGDGGKRTIRAELAAETRLPPAALDPAFRRIARPRGPIRRAQKTRRQDMLRRILAGTLRPAGPHPTPQGTQRPCAITTRMYQQFLCKVLRKAHTVAGDGEEGAPSWVGLGGGSGTPLGAPLEFVLTPTEISVPENAKRFCDDRIGREQVRDAIAAGVEGIEDASLVDTICEAFDGFLRPAVADTEKPSRDSTYLQDLRRDIEVAIDPRTTIPSRTKHRLRLEGPLAERFDEGAPGDPLGEIMACPEFPQPMYEPLRDISESHILPGVEKVPQNTVGLLETNRRFLESYMVGLNHEFAGELLWRRYPTDQRGSCFRQFWNVDAYVPEPSEVDADGNLKADVREALKDIREIHNWGGNLLGNNRKANGGDKDELEANGKDERLVLIVRGDLLKRYPNALIYAIDAYVVEGSDGEPDKLMPKLAEFGDPTGKPIFPIFGGSLGADLVFIGFPFDEDRARSSSTSTGQFFVFEERVSEARFGLDSAQSSVPLQKDPIKIDGWDKLHWGHFQLAEEDRAGGYVDGVSVFTTANGETVSVSITANGETWNANTDAALRARVTLQKPVRLAVHADQMLPPPES